MLAIKTTPTQAIASEPILLRLSNIVAYYVLQAFIKHGKGIKVLCPNSDSESKPRQKHGRLTHNSRTCCKLNHTHSHRKTWVWIAACVCAARDFSSWSSCSSARASRSLVIILPHCSAMMMCIIFILCEGLVQAVACVSDRLSVSMNRIGVYHLGLPTRCRKQLD